MGLIRNYVSKLMEQLQGPLFPNSDDWITMLYDYLLNLKLSSFITFLLNIIQGAIFLGSIYLDSEWLSGLSLAVSLLRQGISDRSRTEPKCQPPSSTHDDRRERLSTNTRTQTQRLRRSARSATTRRRK